jgi:CRISPR-associated protein Cmr6
MSIRIDPKLMKNRNQNYNNTRKVKKYKENISWIFYVEYFKDLNYNNLSHKSNEKKIKNITNKLKNKKIKRNVNKLGDGFILKVDGMGLIAGSGYPHNIKNIKESLQLGLSLDYTTGYPIIPASGIKGVIKHVLEDDNKKEYKNYLLEELKIDEEKLKNDFENTIFLDAEIIEGGFDDEYITPHNKIIKNPVPIKFLKIKKGSKFLFQFIFKSNNLEKDKKLKFFETLIKDIGLGAKTNTGYGYFE